MLFIILVRLDVSVTLNSTLPGCSEYYTSQRGFINSPNYPNVYPPNSDCSYVIDIPSIEFVIIDIIFETFETEHRFAFLLYDKINDKSHFL